MEVHNIVETARFLLRSPQPDFRAIALSVYRFRETEEGCKILLECCRRCQPGELDDLKYDIPESDDAKCLAADLDDLQSYSKDACGLKCNGEWPDKDCDDYKCEYIAHTRDCPYYCGAKSEWKRKA